MKANRYLKTILGTVFTLGLFMNSFITIAVNTYSANIISYKNTEIKQTYTNKVNKLLQNFETSQYKKYGKETGLLKIKNKYDSILGKIDIYLVKYKDRFSKNTIILLNILKQEINNRLLSFVKQNQKQKEIVNYDKYYYSKGIMNNILKELSNSEKQNISNDNSIRFLNNTTAIQLFNNTYKAKNILKNNYIYIGNNKNILILPNGIKYFKYNGEMFYIIGGVKILSIKKYNSKLNSKEIIRLLEDNNLYSKNNYYIVSTDTNNLYITITNIENLITIKEPQSVDELLKKLDDNKLIKYFNTTKDNISLFYNSTNIDNTKTPLVVYYTKNNNRFIIKL